MIISCYCRPSFCTCLTGKSRLQLGPALQPRKGIQPLRSFTAEKAMRTLPCETWWNLKKSGASIAGWWFQHVSTILKNISQWEGLSHILWNIKNVPNHQPDWNLKGLKVSSTCHCSPPVMENIVIAAMENIWKHGIFHMTHRAIENPLFVDDSWWLAQGRCIFAPHAEHVRDYANVHELWVIDADIIWAIVKTLGSRKGHPQIWEGPIAYHTFVK